MSFRRSLPKEMFPADFIGQTHVRQRSVYKFSFEVDEEYAQFALDILGGLPKEGESRPVIIWRPVNGFKAAQDMREELQVIEDAGKPQESDDEESEEENQD